MRDFNIWLGDDEKIMIQSKSDKYSKVTVFFKNIDGEEIYKTDSNFTNDASYWYKVNTSLKELKRIIIEIYSNDILIQSDEISEKYETLSSPKNQEKQLSIFIDKDMGVGDFMWVTPFVRKLYNIYGRKLDVYGYPKYEEFVKNNPYVNNFYDRSKYNKEDINDRNENFDVFYDYGVPYFYSDLRQLACKSAGMTLKDEECELDYIPDEYIKIENLPEYYIVINPRIIKPERTFKDIKDWQRLVDMINDLGIAVVAIGVGPSEHYENLNIKNGLNMVYDDRQNSLSQTWHILNKSQCFITFDTGIYILAGSTDTNILLNGWTCDPWFHQPIRKGDRNYKFYTVRRDCDVFCTTDPKTNVKLLDTIKVMHKSNKCVLNKDYECLPTIQMIVHKLKKILKYE